MRAIEHIEEAYKHLRRAEEAFERESMPGNRERATKKADELQEWARFFLGETLEEPEEPPF